MITDQPTIEMLNFLVKTYDQCVRTSTATQNRIHHLNPDRAPQYDEIVKMMDSMKGKIARRIEKQLEYWPIWTDWMKGVPGIGPATGGRLIMLYYYRFIPICQECGGDLIKGDGVMTCSGCGKTAKGDGVLKYRLGFKYFLHVAGWWKYMGVHCDETGRKPKRKAGLVSDWSSQGRALAYLIGESFIKSKGPYRDFFDERKRKREITHPEASRLHRNNMARHEVAKLFLSHFMEVAKEIEGDAWNRIYPEVIMGHTGIVKPFHWETRNTRKEME